MQALLEVNTIVKELLIFKFRGPTSCLELVEAGIIVSVLLEMDVCEYDDDRILQRTAEMLKIKPAKPIDVSPPTLVLTNPIQSPLF